MEEWKKILNSEFYEVSNYGRVKRLKCRIMRSDGKPFTLDEMVMKPNVTRAGYETIRLSLDIKKIYSVHRLVMMAFCPIDNADQMQVNHIDGNKRNNCIDNLEWCDRKQNMQHAMKTGLFKPQNRFGEKHPLHKLSHEDVCNIRNLLAQHIFTQHYIANLYHVSDTTIHEIKTNKSRYHE